MRIGTADGSARSNPGWGSYIALVIAAFHWPLAVLATNFWQLVHPERVLALPAVVAAAAILLLLVALKLGADRSGAVFSIFVGTVLLMRAGPVLSRFGGPAGWLTIALLVVLTGVVAHRFRDHPALEVSVAALSVALAIGPLLSLHAALSQHGADHTSEVGIPNVELNQSPDIYLVILDTYPGLLALEREFQVNKQALIGQLERRAFQVPASAWSSYWTTETAVPSILEMGYPIERGPLTPASRRRLHEIIGGDNNLMRVLKEHGYQTTVIESGWTGSRCGPEVDRCVRSPWLDDLMFFTLWETAARGIVLSTLGHAYTVGAQHTMSVMKDLAVELRDNAEADFILAHVTAPHGPFFLTPSCETVVAHNRMGDRFYMPGVAEADRDQFFEDQMTCVDRFMIDLADLVPVDDVVIFAGDHGTVRLPFRTIEGEVSWEAVVERLNVFAAVRLAPECPVRDVLVTPNLMRNVLSCYAQSPIDYVPPMMFDREIGLLDPAIMGASPLGKVSPTIQSGN